MNGVNVRRLLVLSVCCLCHLIWGSITSPTYYVNAFRVQYNYTQSQVEVLLPLLSFGRVLSPVPAAIYQTWGLIPILFCGLTLSSGGFLFIWGSGFFLHICSMYPVMIYVCFFCIGLGSGFLNLSIITTVTAHITGKQQGKAVSTVMTSYAASPVITLFLYRKWFAHGQIEDDAAQDLHGYMFCFAITISVMGCLFLCVSSIKTEPESTDVPLLTDTDSEEVAKSTAEEKPSGLKAKVMQEIQAIFQWPLQMLIWSFTLTYSVVTGVDFNLALYAKSSGIYAVFDSTYVIFHATSFLSRLAVGFISDALVGIIPRTFFIAVTSFFLAACLCVMSILPTTELTMYMLSVTTGLAGGVIKPVLVTVLVQNIGKESFAKNWGIAYSLTSCCIAAWSAMFSGLYSAAGGRRGEDCYGGYCLRWVNVVTCAMVAISTCCSLSLTLIKRF